MKRSFYLFIIFFSVMLSCKNQQEVDLNLMHLNHIAFSVNSDLTVLKKEILSLSHNIQYKIPFDQEV
ncbi:MAG: hypothetical protein C0597_04560, partial [Marinilabiliales bacterium]